MVTDTKLEIEELMENLEEKIAEIEEEIQQIKDRINLRDLSVEVSSGNSI